MRNLVLIATFFIVSLSLNAQSSVNVNNGVRVVSLNPVLTNGGVEDWDEDMDKTNGGVEDWDEDMDKTKGGVEDWDEDMDAFGGVEDWDEDMDKNNGGVEDWDEDMDIIFNNCADCAKNTFNISYYDENGNAISFKEFNNRKTKNTGMFVYVVVVDLVTNERRVIRIAM